MRQLAPAASLLLLASACASGRAQLAVEVWPGLAEPPPAALSAHGPERVELVLDMTLSMREPTQAGAQRAQAASAAAKRLVQDLPSGTPVRLHALGIGSGPACVDPALIAESDTERSRSKLLARIDTLARVPTGESSLAAALAGVRSGLADPAQLGRTRVVVITDAGAECGGDLCAAAGDLLSAGARLEFIVLGDAEVPDCVTYFAPTEAPNWASRADPPPFRVEAYDPSGVGGSPVLAHGAADGKPVAVPSGPVTVVLELDPPSRIGPVQLSSGALTQLRVLDFSLLRPRVREWAWKSTAESSDAATAESPARRRVRTKNR